MNAADSRLNSVPDPSLARRLAWTTLFRLVALTLVLGATVLDAWAAREVGAIALYALIGATYAVSAIYGLALRAGRGGRWLAPLQVVIDLALATACVALTGSSESPFVFLFALPAADGAILLGRRGAVAAAAATLVAHAAIALSPGPSRPALLTYFLQACAFALTAILASYLAGELNRTRERLAARESDLAAITALHEAIVQSVTSGIVTVDGAGLVTFLNAAGESITGLRRQEVRGAPAERWFRGLAPVTGRDESDFVNARGETRRLGYTRFPLHGREGRPLGHAIIFQDLTSLRAMEAAVQRSARLADLGQLAAGLAHEIRNPLASMMGSIEMLRSGASLEPEDARLMDIVLREAARLEALVRRFLEFSRPAPPRPELVDLPRLVEETLEVFAHDPAASQVSIERALAPSTAHCDPAQLRQVLWNLLANAAHAAAQGGGHVRVSCELLSGGSVRLTVEDDGPGIPPAEMSRLFTPFHTTKERGTGLGLATVQRIADAHGGRVVVEGVEPHGARFNVLLPAQ